MDKTGFVKLFPVFSKDEGRFVDEMLAAGQVRTIPAGAAIYHEGDACSAIAFVLSGDIRVFKIGQGGREITLYEIGAGETCILNASCILSDRTYPAYASALSGTTVLLFPADLFRRLVREHESMRDFVFTLLSQRLSAVMELVEEVAFGRMDSRLMEYLVERSENGRLETTHQKIANDLGTSREVVSRLLKHFERTGAVELSRSTICLRQTK